MYLIFFQQNVEKHDFDLKFDLRLGIFRIIYDRVRNRKNNFEIPAFLPIEQGIPRAEKFKIQSNVTLRSN